MTQQKSGGLENFWSLFKRLIKGAWTHIAPFHVDRYAALWTEKLSQVVKRSLKVILSHRIQLDPTFKQRRYFAMACGTARMVWNLALAEWNRQYEAGEKPNWAKLKREFNATKYERFPWMKQIHRDAHSQPFANLDNAFKWFFKKIAKHPQFKKKGSSKDSFFVANDKLRIDGQCVVLPKIGRVRLAESLRFVGKIMSATVSRTADRWFISIQVDVSEHRKQRSGNIIVGVDLGVKTAATLSTGEKVTSPKPLKFSLKKLARIQRKFSRQKKGSKNRGKTKLKISRLHAKIANIRKDFLHKLTTRLSRENQTIVIEDLNVQGMMANRKLSCAISDIGFYEFRRQLEYKSEIYETKIVIADRWYPSSKTCSKCGWIDKKLKLFNRTFHCDSCGNKLDRDVNAAMNLRTLGLSGIACGSEGSDSSRKASVKPCRVEAGTKSCPFVGTN